MCDQSNPKPLPIWVRKLSMGRVLLIVGVIAGVLGIVLCADILWFNIRGVHIEGSSDPVTIDTARSQMARMAVPKGFMPFSAGRIDSVRYVSYIDPAIGGHLQLIAIGGAASEAEKSLK